MFALRAAVIAFGIVIGISGAHAQDAAETAANDMLQRALKIEIIAASAPYDRRVQAVAAAMVTDLRVRAQLLMQADQNRLMREEFARVRAGG